MALKVLRRLRRLAFELAFLLGCLVFSYGFWLAWRPLGFIVGGALLAAIAFLAGYQRPAAPTAESEG